MSAHADHCSCVKPEGAWGDGGFHMFEATGAKGEGVTRGGNPLTTGTTCAYEKCPAYWAAKAARLTLEERLLAAGVPERYLGYRRSGFDGWPEAASEWLREPAGVLYIHGANGTGKTHLGTAILREILEEGVACRWVSAKLVPELRPDRSETDTAREEALRTARVLLLDDLFSERSTPYGAERLRNLLEVRYLRHRPTIVTSMLSPEDAMRIDSDLASRACTDKRIKREGMDRRWQAAAR